MSRPPPQVLSDEGHWETLRSFTPMLLPYTSSEKLHQVRRDVQAHACRLAHICASAWCCLLARGGLLCERA